MVARFANHHSVKYMETMWSLKSDLKELIDSRRHVIDQMDMMTPLATKRKVQEKFQSTLELEKKSWEKKAIQK